MSGVNGEHLAFARYFSQGLSWKPSTVSHGSRVRCVLYIIQQGGLGTWPDRTYPMAVVDRHVPVHFLRTLFEPMDWIAIFLKSYERTTVARR